MQQQFPSLTNFENPPPVSEFERAHQIMRCGNSHQIMAAQQSLSEFQGHPQAFTRAHEILTNTSDEDTRFFALSIINREILATWNKFTPDEQNGIKSFLVNQLVAACGNGINAYRSNRLSVSKYNQALVSIAKREYPSRWPTFVVDVAAGANANDAMMENTLKIFTLVGEEIFEFGDRSNLMTSRWVAAKRRALATDFKVIYEVCIAVLQRTNDPLLLESALQCIEKFIPFVDLQYVFNGDVLQFICGLVSGDLRDAALRVLSEVVAVPISDGVERNNQIALASAVFTSVVENVEKILPTNHSTLEPRVHALFANGGNRGRDLVSSIAYFLTTFYMTHIQHVQQNRMALEVGHQLLTGISHCDDKEIFKQAVDYWWWLGEQCIRRNNEFKNVIEVLSETFKNVRFVLIRKMPKPEEVIFVEDDNGEVQRESMGEDVEALQLYARVREALIFYVKLDPRDTVQILYTLVDKQEDRSELGYLSLGTLCWSIGSIAGVLDVTQERTLFTRIIRTLLQLCRDCKRTSERAMVASNIMYIAGQYGRFLRTHLTFSHTVCKKLFEFMRESFDGVQDMAVDTFLKIAASVPLNFYEIDPQTNMVFVEYILVNIDDIVDLLNFAQINIFCEALGKVIAAGPENRQEELLDRLMQRTNVKIQESAEVAVNAPMVAYTTDHLKDLISVLKSHVAVAKTVGPVYLTQMCKIFANLEGYYRFYVNAINNEVAQQGSGVINHQHVRLMRAVKKEFLTIFEFFITGSASNGANLQFIADTCLPSILNLVLSDYKESIPVAKDPIVLTLVSACVRVLSSQLNRTAVVQLILENTFDCTVEMIAPTMHEFPDHRKNLIALLQALCANCFEAFLECASAKPEVIEGMLWAVKHTDHAIMVIALETLGDFIQKVAQSGMALGFFQTYLHQILTEVLLAVLDKLHASALPYHCTILVNVFRLVAQQPWDTPVVGGAAVQAHLTECLSHLEFLTANQINQFIQMSLQVTDDRVYLQQIQDFLIEIDVWGAAQENEEADRIARMEREMAVPELVREQAGTRYNDLGNNNYANN